MVLNFIYFSIPFLDVTKNKTFQEECRNCGRRYKNAKKANKPPSHQFRYPVFISIALNCANDKNVHSFGCIFGCQFLVCVNMCSSVSFRGGRNSSHSQGERKPKTKSETHRDEKEPQCKFYFKTIVRIYVDPRYIAIRIINIHNPDTEFGKRTLKKNVCILGFSFGFNATKLQATTGYNYQLDVPKLMMT